jgi:hypothetical protein
MSHLDIHHVKDGHHLLAQRDGGHEGGVEAVPRKQHQRVQVAQAADLWQQAWNMMWRVACAAKQWRVLPGERHLLQQPSSYLADKLCSPSNWLPGGCLNVVDIIEVHYVYNSWLPHDENTCCTSDLFSRGWTP